MRNTQWQNARNDLRTYTLHKSTTANESDSQNNCSMCPPFNRITAFSLSRQWSIDLSMICWWRFSQQVSALSLRSPSLKIVVRYMLCCRALIYSVINRVQVRDVGTIQTVRCIFTKHFSSYMNAIVNALQELSSASVASATLAKLHGTPYHTIFVQSLTLTPLNGT